MAVPTAEHGLSVEAALPAVFGEGLSAVAAHIRADITVATGIGAALAWVLALASGTLGITQATATHIMGAVVIRPMVVIPRMVTRVTAMEAVWSSRRP
jgi:Na+/phosphate symporter